MRSLLQLVLSKLGHILQVEMLWPLLDALGVVLGVVIIRRLLLILKVLKTSGYKLLAKLFRSFLQLVIIQCRQVGLLLHAIIHIGQRLTVQYLVD